MNSAPILYRLKDYRSNYQLIDAFRKERERLLGREIPLVWEGAGMTACLPTDIEAAAWALWIDGSVVSD